MSPDPTPRSQLSAVGSAALPPLETANVLHRTIEELERLKRQLRQPYSAKAQVEAAITRLERGLQIQSKELVQAGLAAQQRAAAAATQTIVHVGATFKKPSPLPPITPSAAERVAHFKADPLAKPQSQAARAYLQERYGVPAPSKSGAGAQGGTGERPAGGPAPGAMSKGLTPAAAPGVILPKNMRDHPYATAPQQVTDLELEKGLFHLVNRGMVSNKADLTPALCGELGPVRMGGISLKPHATQFSRPAPTSALEDSMLATQNFKLDLLTPVVKPAVAAAKAAALRLVGFQGSSSPGQQPGFAPAGGAEAGGRSGVGSVSETGAGGRGGEEGEESRPYEMLMDTFSLHEFMIRKGSVIDTTPEFESYRRTYQPLWAVIQPLIQQLEVLCKQYAIPLAIVDGRSLADLAHGCLDSGVAPQMQDLLVCVQNIQEVAALLRQPGRRFMGEGGNKDAATTIQAAWRGHLARRKYSKQGVAAAAIQNVWRMHRLRHQLVDRLRAARAERDRQFALLQQQLCEEWGSLQSSSHVVVHIPGMTRSQQMTMQQKLSLLAAEAAQLARLCDLAEPLVEVVLVLPSPLDPDVVSYWDKILEVGGVSSPSSRYRIVYPENHARLPSHMSTAAMLLSSPRALKRLRSAVSGRLGYILPGCVGEEEVDLAVALGLPLMGPMPHMAKTLSRKSAARTVFASAGVLIAPGIVVLPRSQLPPPPRKVGPNGVEPLTPHTQYHITQDGEVIVTENAPPAPPPSRTQLEEDEERVLRQLSEAMVRSPWASKWLVKVDDEIGGAGHAFFDTLSIKGAADVLERTIIEERGQAVADPGVPLNESQRVAAYRLNELLTRQLPRKLALAARDVYPTYRDFIHAVATRGGVVEAVPSSVVGSPQANLFIDPNGGIALLSTHEKIFVSPYRSVGSTFPQTSVPHKAIQDASLAVAAACQRAGVIGHLAVDFVTHVDEERGGALRLWAVDLVLAPTPSLMAYQLFDFLTVGSFDPDMGTYSVELEPLGPEESQQEAAGQQGRQGTMPRGSSAGAVPASREGYVEGGHAGPRESETSLSLSARQPIPSVAGNLGAPDGASQAGVGTSNSSPPTDDRALVFGDDLLLNHDPGASPDMSPPQADAALMGERPATADLPSGLPSTRGSSSTATRPGTVGSLLGPQHQHHSRASASNQQDDQQPQQQQGAGASSRAVGQQISHSRSEFTVGEGTDGRATAGGDSTAASGDPLAASPPTPPGTQRFFFALDAVSNPAIAATPCSKFFHACWQEGLHYDVDNRVGVIFNLSDKYMTGTLGILAVGMAPHEMYGAMQNVLTFVAGREREVAAAAAATGPGPGGRRGRGGAADAGGEGGLLTSELRSFRDVQALVKYMAEKSAVVAAAMQGTLPLL